MVYRFCALDMVSPGGGQLYNREVTQRVPEGRSPSKILSFWRLSATSVADSRQKKENCERGFASLALPPNCKVRKNHILRGQKGKRKRSSTALLKASSTEASAAR